MRWSEADIPDQSGRVAVVTGANAGLGFEIARVLARHGAHVVLASRDPGKAKLAADRIRAEGGQSAHVRLDLASLASVRAAATEIRATCQRLDLLINNAGVMDIPYERTEDGFELTLATNHLGHFALTGLVLDRLLATPGARVVTMSSIAHLSGVVHFDDLQSEREYQPAAAYGQSKLANLMFTYELDRRLRAQGAGVAALAAHPGVVYTALFKTQPRWQQVLISPRMRLINFWAVQSAQMGALPALRAATSPAAQGGEYYGPWRRHHTGYPAPVQSSPRSHDEADQARLWEISERLTGVRYEIGDARTPA
ncbi:MAG TPA: oxidoreductase [Streptosporangiaceae bacterium]